MHPSKLMRRLIPIVGVWSLLVSCSQSDSSPAMTTDEVIVKTANMDVHFSRGKSFAQTYMIFGGIEMKQGDAISKVTLSGLDINTARYIYSRYPDFHLCKSPGAPLAQRAVRQLDIVPADSNVVKVLRETLAGHKKSLQPGGTRACVRLQGEVLKLTSAIVRDANQDITNELPPQMHHEYFLVQSAENIDSQEALAGK